MGSSYIIIIIIIIIIYTRNLLTQPHLSNARNCKRNELTNNRDPRNNATQQTKQRNAITFNL